MIRRLAYAAAWLVAVLAAVAAGIVTGFCASRGTDLATGDCLHNTAPDGDDQPFTDHTPEGEDL